VNDVVKQELNLKAAGDRAANWEHRLLKSVLIRLQTLVDPETVPDAGIERQTLTMAGGIADKGRTVLDSLWAACEAFVLEDPGGVGTLPSECVRVVREVFAATREDWHVARYYRDASAALETFRVDVFARARFLEGEPTAATVPSWDQLVHEAIRLRGSWNALLTAVRAGGVLP
jgi:hypothetical protein